MTSTADDGSVNTLRWAIGQANSTLGGAEIIFQGTVWNTPQTITLTSGLLDLNNTSGSEAIVDPAAPVTINCNGQSRAFSVEEGVTASISNVTITNGKESDDYGGGVYNRGQLTLSHCAIINSTSDNYGAALYNTSTGTVNLNNCTLNNDSSAGYGGALANYEGAMNLTDSTVTNGAAGADIDNNQFDGGGLYDYDGTLTLTNCTVNNDSCAGDDGGGLYIQDSMATLTNCTFSQDSAGGDGGGAYNFTPR